ncbi:MAG: hypothetical protein HY702_00790 [Gemmatimonadetes bacterium]|nr:hypothetical protein [Gemmatimonadota bacterium]
MMLGQSRSVTVLALSTVVLFFGCIPLARAQVSAEPAFVGARIPDGSTAQAYTVFSSRSPRDQFLFAGMLRFGVSQDVDIGGRAGVAVVGGGEDYVYAGAEARYGLVHERLTRAGLGFDLTLHGGLGVSSPGDLTRWKIPLGLPGGLTFPFVRGPLEIFAHPRLEVGLQNRGDREDVALVMDVGAYWQVGPVFGGLLDARVGDGVFDEGNRAMVGLSVSARF